MTSAHTEEADPPRGRTATHAPRTKDAELTVLSRRPNFIRTLWRGWSPRVAIFILVAVAGMGILAPYISPYEPMNFVADRLEDPSWSHPLGTDRLGRDVLTRVMYGARFSVGTALMAASLITLLGVFFGSLAGYFGGWLDAFLMRLVDVILAFPTLILALVVAGLFEASILTVILILSSVWWVGYARVIRGLVLSVREWEFVEAAHALGATHRRILVRHILPQIIPPVIVLATLEMGTLILALAGLNFLGLGVEPPTPEWGAMINDGRDHFFSAPHLILVPGVAIGLTVLGFNLLGDGLRDVLDPRMRARVDQ